MDLRYALIFSTTGADGVREVLAAALLSAEGEVPRRVYRRMFYRLPAAGDAVAERPEDKTDAPHLVILHERTRYGLDRTEMDLLTEEEAVNALSPAKAGAPQPPSEPALAIEQTSDEPTQGDTGPSVANAPHGVPLR